MNKTCGLIFFLLPFVTALSACGINLRPEVRALLVPDVSLSRYAGLWYQVARYPHFFQGGNCGDSTAEYTLLSNGTVSVLNRCWKTTNGGSWNQEVRAVGVPADSNANFLIVTFYGLFSAGYLIIELDRENYRWAAVTTPDRNTLWILCREPSLDLVVFDRIVSALAIKGFDPKKIIKTSRQQ